MLGSLSKSINWQKVQTQVCLTWNMNSELAHFRVSKTLQEQRDKINVLGWGESRVVLTPQPGMGLQRKGKLTESPEPKG